jgi:hypothetical protein
MWPLREGSVCNWHPFTIPSTWCNSDGMLFPVLERLLVAQADVQGSPPPACTWLIRSGFSCLNFVNSIEGCRVHTSDVSISLH